jgi:uncharacterized protein YciI
MTTRLTRDGTGIRGMHRDLSSRRALMQGTLATAFLAGLSTIASAEPARQLPPSPPPERAAGAMKFINLVKYKNLDKIADARAAHFAYADRLREQGNLAVGGPIVDAHGRRIGLIFIYEAASKEEALSFAREDPFTLANALSSSEITEWRLRGANLDLLVRANRSGDKGSSEAGQIRLFANYAKYGADKSKLDAVRPAHWKYDQALKASGKLALAGPFADNTGGLFVYHAADSDEATSDLMKDPFAREGVFADCEVFEWLIGGVRPELLTADFAAEDSESASVE